MCPMSIGRDAVSTRRGDIQLSKGRIGVGLGSELVEETEEGDEVVSML